MKLNEDQIDVLLRRTADAMHLVGVGGIIASVFDDATIGLSLLDFMFFTAGCCIELWRIK